MLVIDHPGFRALAAPPRHAPETLIATAMPRAPFLARGSGATRTRRNEATVFDF
jgi:hypothetical protein